MLIGRSVAHAKQMQQSHQHGDTKEGQPKSMRPVAGLSLTLRVLVVILRLVIDPSSHQEPLERLKCDGTRTQLRSFAQTVTSIDDPVVGALIEGQRLVRPVTRLLVRLGQRREHSDSYPFGQMPIAKPFFMPCFTL